MDWPRLDPLDEDYLLKAYRSRRWGTRSPFVEEFEREFARYHGAKHAVAVTGGTAGLMLAYLAAGVKPGDKVAVPAYTFIATASAAVVWRAVPLFVDVDPQTLNMDPSDLDRVVEKHEDVKLVVPVHFAGIPAEMDEILKIARVHDASVVEDAAQAHGSAYRGRRVGAIGDAGVFSFQLSKLMAAGEGGIVLTNRYDLYEAVWSLHHVGRRFEGEWYEHVRIGWNFRMTEFQAAVLLSQLKRLDNVISTLERNWRIVVEGLERVDGVEVFRPPKHVDWNFYFTYVKLPKAVEYGLGLKLKFVKMVRERGVNILEGYVKPLYKQPALRDPYWSLPSEFYGKLYLKNTEEACASVAWLPHYELLTEDEARLEKIVGAVKEAAREVLS
ncbi:MAG: DegT/DnrJ/EryC1/StrS family aminotransferase [Thermofilaceae archaeon]|nr:DegT/DnrJ/EryC1/StrS family aminotransferase [Thermofilaceae archaeon]MCX8179920.1 DegT/DnrJ/EryC1/StrS family aminotransferase [Thermofilaceae archaeon]MDW8004389.1 DegT/DnrJ/EryC1/StrS family aminotransferase [Thermofilaceae archaeon]